MQHLSGSYQNLRSAQQKFRDCIANVKAGVAESTKGWSFSIVISSADSEPDQCSLDKPILVPLTSSLYVPGTLADTEHVIVDVGTGFYVEKSTKDADVFYNGKIEELGKNIKDLENITNGKANNLRMVEEAGQFRSQVTSVLRIILVAEAQHSIKAIYDHECECDSNAGCRDSRAMIALAAVSSSKSRRARPGPR